MNEISLNTMGWTLDVVILAFVIWHAIGVASDPVRRYLGQRNIFQMLTDNCFFDAQSSRRKLISDLLVWVFWCLIIWALFLCVLRVAAEALQFPGFTFHHFSESVSIVFESHTGVAVIVRVATALLATALLVLILSQTRWLAENNFVRNAEKRAQSRKHGIAHLSSITEQLEEQEVYLPTRLKAPFWFSVLLLPRILERHYGEFLLDHGRMLNGNAQKLVRSFGVETFIGACKRIVINEHTELPVDVTADLKHCFLIDESRLELAERLAKRLFNHDNDYASMHRLVHNEAYYQYLKVKGDVDLSGNDLRLKLRHAVNRKVNFKTGQIGGAVGKVLDVSEDGSGLYICTEQSDNAMSEHPITIELGRITIKGFVKHTRPILLNRRTDPIPGIGVDVMTKDQKLAKRLLLNRNEASLLRRLKQRSA